MSAGSEEGRRCLYHSARRRREGLWELHGVADDLNGIVRSWSILSGGNSAPVLSACLWRRAEVRRNRCDATLLAPRSSFSLLATLIGLLRSPHPAHCQPVGER